MISPHQDIHDFLHRLCPGPFLEAMFAIIPEGCFFIKDRESRFMAASLSFAHMLEESSGRDVIGKTDFDYSADFLAEAFVADDRRVMTTGQPMIRKVELVPSGDSLDWRSTTKVPLRGDDGSVIGLVGVCQVILDSDDLYRNHPEMRGIVQFIADRFREKVTIADMARAAGISVSSVERLFRNTFGVTPLMYLRKTRLNAACRMLHQDDLNLSAIAGECGFCDQTSMTRAFRQELKITPLKYRRRFSETVLVK